MTGGLDQTEHAAAELLGFLQTGGNGTPTAGGPSPQNGNGSNPSTAAAVTHISLPTINTTTLRPSGGSLPTLSSPRSRQPNSLRSRGNRGMLTPTAAAAAAAGGGTTSLGLHPVVRLGWKPLCSVICNGLRGEFLGGHDRDMFMKVTSGHYAGLPLIDVSLGGCIMTCSQFERYAGRELSKKWKESIHVVGEGEGSRATLLSWLKRKAEQDFGAAVVGKKIWVCWCADAEYYQGTIVSYNREGGKHTVQYSSRLSEDLHLAVEMISFDAEKPTVPAAAAAGAAAVGDGNGGAQGPAVSAPAGAVDYHGVSPRLARSERAAAGGGNTNDGVGPLLFPTATTAAAVGAAGVHQSPLFHQGSGISVTSSYGDELRGNAALFAMATGVRGIGNGAGGVRTAAAGGTTRTRGGGGGGGGSGLGGGRLGSDGEGNEFSPRRRRKPVHKEDEIAMPPPKRALSAPAAVLLAEAAAAAAAAAEEQQEEKEKTPPGASPAGFSNRMHYSGIQSPHPLSPPSSLMMPLPPPPLGGATATATPEALPAPAAAAAVGWMHDVALCLDKEMEDAEREKSTNSAPFTSPSGRFQALLGLLAGTPACLAGLYESMVRRYNHFAGIPQLQRQKIVELMLATLVEAAAPRDLFKSVEEKADTTITAGGARGQQTNPPSPSPSLLNNAKNTNHNNDHQGHLKMGIDDEEAMD